MGKASGPPKCRTCGKEEWRHICGRLPKTSGVTKGRRVVASASARGNDRSSKREVECATVPARVLEPSIPPTTTPLPKTDRKEYLKLKARERRAAEKAGLTLAQYRAQKEAS